MQALYEKVVNIVRKPAEQRTVEEISEVLPWFMTRNAMMGGLKQDVAADIVRNCKFFECERDHVIIRQGDIGDCFYIILSGVVSIWINTEAVPDDPSQARVLVHEGEDSTVDEKTGKMQLDRSKYGNHIVKFEAGKAFGELALINKNCMRNASIISDETTHLIVVDRELYNRCLKAAHLVEFRRRQAIVDACVLFDGWAPRYKRQAAMSLQQEDLHYGDVIFKQGEPVNGLAFILQGEARVVLDALQHFKQYPNLRLNEDLEDEKKRDLYGEIRGSTTVEAKVDHKQLLWTPPVRRQGYVVAEQRQLQRQLEIVVLAPGEYVGALEYGMGLPTISETSYCTQSTLIYRLVKSNFDRLVFKRNPKTLRMLKTKAEQMIAERKSRSFDVQVPLVKKLNAIMMESQKERDVTEEAISNEVNLAKRASQFVCPPRGPLIDLHGPGTVFYRNRMERVEKLKKKRAASRLKRIQNVTAHSMFSVNIGAVADFVDSDSDSSDLEPGLVVKKEVLFDDDDDDSDEGKEEPVEDWETSSDYLGDLERGVHRWYRRLPVAKSEDTLKQQSDKVIHLQRSHELEKTKFHPGKKIILRNKKINAASDLQDARNSGAKEDRTSKENKSFGLFGSLIHNPRPLSGAQVQSYTAVEVKPPIRVAADEETTTSSSLPISKPPSPHLRQPHRLQRPHSAAAAFSRPIGSDRGGGGIATPDSRDEARRAARAEAASRLACVIPPAAAADPLGYMVRSHVGYLADAADGRHMSAEIGDVLTNRVAPLAISRKVAATSPPSDSAWQTTATNSGSGFLGHLCVGEGCCAGNPRQDTTTQQLRRSTFPLIRRSSLLLPSRLKAIRCGNCLRSHVVLAATTTAHNRPDDACPLTTAVTNVTGVVV